MGKFYNVAANAGVGKGRVAMGWVWEVSLNLLIEQTNFVLYNVKIRLHIPKLARGMDTV